MNKKEQIRRLKQCFDSLIRQGLVEVDSLDKIDFEAEVDGTLRYRENKRNLLDMYQYCNVREEDYKEAKEEYIREAREAKEKAFKESLEKDSGEDYFKTLRTYTEMIGYGYATSMIVCGKGGVGKTYQVMKTLDSMAVDYEYINSYSTPLSLYTMLYVHNGKVIVLDDFEGILTSRTGIGILKAALWSASGKREVCYNSTSDKVMVPPKFEFKGRIVFCLNSIGDNAELMALRSRTLFYEMELDIYDLKKILMDMARRSELEGLKEEERIEVAKYIVDNADLATKDLNLRTLVKACWTYRYCRDKGGDWKPLVDALLKPDMEKKAILELDNQFPSDVGIQVKEYKMRTGKSRASFFRLRKEMGLSRDYAYH